MNRLVLGLGLVFGLVGVASAGPQPADTPKILYLNRCAGGCTVVQGTDDAKASTSSIPRAADNCANPSVGCNLTAFAWGDAQWDAVVKCVREVYSPFNIQIVTDEPSGDVLYNEQMVAGLGGELGRSDAGGISPAEPCGDPANNMLTFTFANGYGNPSALAQVYDICAVVAQESGHAYGLDHEYQFNDGVHVRSACTDPMTYRTDCGGQRFFRNDLAECGEFNPRACMCENPQNSHLRLLSILGPGTPITSKPTLVVNSPLPNATIVKGARIIAVAGAQRGVRRVEVRLNGYKWNEAPGADFGVNGQPDATYNIAVPDDVPDGVIDIEVTAKDDIDVATVAPIIRVTKGVACTTSDTCLAGQRCDDQGRCLWDPATGNLGDPCDYPQFCTSGICTGAAGEDKICTTDCVLTASDSCPMGYDCIQSAPGQGVCLVSAPAASGCCSTGGEGVAQSSLLAIGLGVLLRRRRRQ